MTDQLRIEPTKNGPLRVEGVSVVTRMADGESIATKSTAFLCRCGGSANKPFCDGAHSRIGFTSDVDPDRVPDSRQSYTSSDERITISDNRGLCAHSGICTDNLATVFRVGGEPFVDADGGVADEIAAVIRQCPSGALSYTLDGVRQPKPEGDPGVAFAPGGPYLVSGVGELVADGLPAGSATDPCTLCRCGASQNKPFCNGKHWDIDFDEDAPKS